MIGPITRIASRYVSGMLVTYGLVAAPDAAMFEPDIALAIGAAIGAITEGIYSVAKSNGWRT